MWTVIYNIVEQVTLDLQHRDVTEETLNGYGARTFHAYAAAERVSKRFLALELFCAAYCVLSTCKLALQCVIKNKVPDVC